MDFRTELSIPEADFQFSHKDRIFSIGSCFAEEIGLLLEKSKFSTLRNPFGTLFHPVSIENAIARIHSRLHYTEGEIFNYEDIFFSWDHHTSFNKNTLKQTISGINESLDDANEFLRYSKVAILTFGTAWAYKLRGSDLIVANCHKIPQQHFEKVLLTDTQLKTAIRNSIDLLKDISPDIRVILTVSPVRHLKDGFIENNLSKAKLISNLFDCAINLKNVHYFPAYELVMDDLRDYRFYKEDLVHPNELAVKYIWRKFSHSYFSGSTLELIKRAEKINSALHHRPLNPGGLAHKKFLYQTMKNIQELSAELLPGILEEDIKTLKEKINNAD